MIKPLTETIKIVTYHEGLAKSIADMWNESRDSWGGDAAIMTEEQVKEKEANSEDLILYLALYGDKVVGYCGISEYKEDKEALYIRLLNVHPDYHGQKIGKQLVLKAVEKTVELGWPRIDLYTWPGNVKAVPLYKKCGFFWEDRDETTHLMNFIPKLLQNEITKSFFQYIDWYKDNIRAIEVKPDGINENGFTYFEYVWKNDNYYLRVQLEKSGRGIRLIETNDFKIEISIAQHTQIEGLESKLFINVKNKNIQPARLYIEGQKNDRITVHGEKDVHILDEETIEFPVHIKAGEEPNAWITHPRAEVKINIDGKAAIFSLGVYPKKAMKIKAVYQPKKYELSDDQYCFLEIENHLNNEAMVTVELTDHPSVSWEKSTYSALIKDIGIIRLPFKIIKYGFLQSECIVKVQSGDDTFEWNDILAFPMPNFGVKDGGFDKEYFYLQNGFYKVIVRKRDNAISFGNEQQLIQRTVLFPPKFGKPYISEISKKQASSFAWDYDNGTARMKIYYDIEKPLEMKLALCFELYAEGLLNYWLEIENISGETKENLFVYHPIRHELNQTYIPIKNEIVYFNDSKYTDLGQLNSKDVTENWIFSIDRKEPHGFTWDKNVKLGFDGWLLYLEATLQNIDSGNIIRTEPIRFSIGAIKMVEDFQEFAVKDSKNNNIISELEVKPNSGNPIITNKELNLVLKRSQNRYFKGILAFKENNKTICTVDVTQENEQVLNVKFQTKAKAFVPIQYELNSESQKISGSFLILHQDETKIKTNKLADGSHSILEIENGDLKFRTATGFFPTLYSVNYQGQEWFDSSYPSPKPKAWWNPWAGGMRSYLNGISLFSILKESTEAYFVKRSDQFNNEWEGFAIQTVVKKHEKWKGLKVIQYFLTLPGVPIIAHFSELEHRNRTIYDYFHTELWINKNSLKDTTVNLHGVTGSKSFHAGYEEHVFRASNPYTFSNSSQTEFLQVLYSKEFENECIFSEEFALASTADYLKIEPGRQHYTNPTFLLFPNHPVDQETIESLKSITF